VKNVRKNKPVEVEIKETEIKKDGETLSEI
jgi:hypothetical protein